MSVERGLFLLSFVMLFELVSLPFPAKRVLRCPAKRGWLALLLSILADIHSYQESARGSSLSLR